MSTLKTEFKYIEINDDGVPMIAGTQTKVVDIIQEFVYWGWNPEQIHVQHPDLSKSQIYSAFAYYADHEDEMNRDIERRYHEAESIMNTAPIPEVERRLHERGIL